MREIESYLYHQMLWIQGYSPYPTPDYLILVTPAFVFVNTVE